MSELMLLKFRLNADANELPWTHTWLIGLQQIKGINEPQFKTIKPVQQTFAEKTGQW